MVNGFISTRYGLIITHNDFPEYEGLSERIKGIIQILQSQKIKPIIIAPQTRKRNLSQPKGIICIRIKIPSLILNFYGNRKIFRLLFEFYYTFKLLSLIKKIKPFNSLFIQSEQLYSIIPSKLLSLILNKRLIFDDLTLVSTHFKKQKNFILFFVFFVIEMIFLNLTNKIISTSNETNNFIGKFKSLKKKVIFLPNGIVTSRNKSKLISEFSEKSPMNILFLGSMYYLQNQIAIEWYITKIHPELQKKISNSRIFIVGGPLTALKKEKIIEWKIKLKKKGKILGFVDNKERFYQSCEFFILPYPDHCKLTGGARIKALEAMSRGLIVFSTKNGIEGIDGLIKGVHYIEFSNEEDFVSKFIELAQNKKLRKEISNNAAIFINKNFDWITLGKEYIDYLNKI